MMITFRSAAPAADVMMFGDVAEKMMQIIGKDFSDKGIITVEDLPDAIVRLKAAISADVQARNWSEPDRDDEESVGIVRRALPLVELFEQSLKGEVPVVWGM